MSLTHTDVVLGTPCHSWSTLKADLIRLRRSLDCDDEEAASRHITSLHPDRVRIALIDKIIDHIRPVVEEEARFYELEEQRSPDLAEDRVDEAAKRA